MTVANLPVDTVLAELKATLADHSRVVFEAPPGAGKTTRVAPALLDSDWLADRKILLLEPRRIAARAAAEFMAAERNERVGDSIGYRIRFETRVCAATRIEVVTEGILTRMLQDDPELCGVGAIVFDEFHERHLHGDLGVALALDVQSTLRADLRLVIMSATLDGERIAQWFNAPRITSAGRSHEVRIAHPPMRADETWPERGWPFGVRRAIEIALSENAGDMLVFLPGKREIERVRDALHDLSDDAFQPSPSRGGPAGDGAHAATIASRLQTLPRSAIEIVPLHGELTLTEQRAALAPAVPGTRRIVLATNVAESSVTLPGIRAVLDTGLAREPRFDPNSAFTRLDTVRIAQSSADQRAGRAGRLGPGTCYRLWPQSRRLDAERMPEIAQVELSHLALELAGWGTDALNWLDPPPPGALAQARDLLQRLGALDGDLRITEVGRRLLRLGAQPRLGTAVLRVPERQRDLACDIAALVEARNPLRGDAARSDDFRLRVAALRAWRERGRSLARGLGAHHSALAAIALAADTWRRRVACLVPTRTNADRGRDSSLTSPDHSRSDLLDEAGSSVGNVLIHAFSERIAHCDASDPRRYILANGRGARLLEDSALAGEAWLVVVELRSDARDSVIVAAAPFDGGLLESAFPQRFATARSVRWNSEAGRVEAFEQRCFDAIVLNRRAVPASAQDIVSALLGAVHGSGLDTLPWSEASRELRLRVEALRRWCPELGLPDFSDAALSMTLEHWLSPSLANLRRLDALQPAKLHEALSAQLDFAIHRALDEQAPASIRVPSGLERRIDYAGETPILAVKLQELFGLAETPCIARGRVPLTLHLLSPGGKPVQVTQDLKGFWERTYPEVKKELKGRYPKHPWPDDPWTATPTHRAKPRR